MNNIRFFCLGERPTKLSVKKFWQKKENSFSKELEYGKYRGIKYIIPKGKTHGLDFALSNDLILNKFFFKDILSESMHGIAIDKNNESYIFGTKYPKNIFNRLSLKYNYEDKKITLVETGLDKKRKHEIPIDIIANRVRWFLNMTPFVSSFIEEKFENRYEFTIEYV